MSLSSDLLESPSPPTVKERPHPDDGKILWLPKDGIWEKRSTLNAHQTRCPHTRLHCSPLALLWGVVSVVVHLPALILKDAAPLHICFLHPNIHCAGAGGTGFWSQRCNDSQTLPWEQPSLSPPRFVPKPSSHLFCVCLFYIHYLGQTENRLSLVILRHIMSSLSLNFVIIKTQGWASRRYAGPPTHTST